MRQLTRWARGNTRPVVLGLGLYALLALACTVWLDASPVVWIGLALLPLLVVRNYLAAGSWAALRVDPATEPTLIDAPAAAPADPIASDPVSVQPDEPDALVPVHEAGAPLAVEVAPAPAPAPERFRDWSLKDLDANSWN